MKKRIIYLCFLFLITLFVFGCKNNNIENVALDGEAPKYVYEGFNIESLSLIVTFKDGEVSIIQVNNSMLDKNEQNEIKALGLHHITIEYKGFEIPLELLVVQEKSNYKVSYYLESLEGEYILDSVEELTGNTFTEPIINKNYDGFYSGRFNSAFIQPDGTTEISVYFQRKSYSIDVVFENQILKSYKFKYGENIKLKEPELQNYSFVKWVDEIPETMPASDLVINAEMELINFVCKFVDYDGTVICEVIGNIDTIIQVPLEPTRDSDDKYSYTFSHWDGFREGMILDGNYVFKAVYNNTIRSYTITFKDYDGTILYSELLHYDDRIIYKGVHPERLPNDEFTYEFLGWDKSFNYVKGNEEFTAKYKEYKRYFSVDVDIDGDITNYKVENGQSLVLDTPVKKGYTFVKWSHNLSKINNDMTIYAEFSPNYYSITYRIHNSFYKSVIYKYGDEIIPIEHLDIDGFYFVDWIDVPKTMPDSDIIINAKYLQIPNVSLMSDLNKVYDGKRIDDPNLYITGKPKYKWEIYSGNTLLTSNPYRAGSYVLKVEIESDDEYLGNVYYFDFEISKRDAKIIVEDKESIYGDDFSKLTYITEGFVTNPIINIEKEEGYLVGEYNIIASCDDRNYNIEIQNGIYTITKRNIDVQIMNKTSVYKEELLELSYEIIEGNICNNDNLNIVITKEEGLDAGNYEITGIFDNDNYLVSFINGVYTIEKAQSIITMNSELSYVYDGQSHDLQFTLNHDEEELIIDGNGNINAGEYLVTVSVKESKNYLGNNAEYKYVINKAQSVITGSDINVIYDGNEYSIEATLNHSEKEIIYFNNTHTNAGEYIVNCKVDESTNYTGVSRDFIIKINKAETILTGSDVEKVYDGKVVEIDCSINHNESAIEFDILNIVDAGTYIVTLTAKESTNYKGASKIVNVVISKAQSVITLNSLTEYTYDGKIHSIIYKLNHNESEIIYTGNDQVNAGKYSVTAEVKETKNYKGVVVTNELIINKAETVLTLDSLTEYTYDGKVHSIVYKINHNESEIIYTGNDQVNAGNYDVSIEVKESDNYKGLSFTKELIINKAESIIETENITVTYDKETHSIVGTLNHNETQVEYIGNDKVNAGEYVVVLYAKETTNYKEARKEAKLVINKADSVITLDSGLEFVYNGSVQGIKCKLNHTEGTLVYSNNNNTIPGKYNVVVLIEDTINYNGTSLEVNYEILKAHSIITAENLTVEYDGNAHSIIATLNHNDAELIYSGSNFTNVGIYSIEIKCPDTEYYYGASVTVTLTIYTGNFTYEGITFNNAEYTYDGLEKSIFINGELPEGMIVTYTGNGVINAGEYEVYAHFDDPSGNYVDITPLKAVIKINKAETILTGSDVEKVYDGKVVEIDCSINHNESAIEFDILNIVDAGTYIVTLTAKESTNYKGASKIVNVVISKAQSVITLNSLTEYTYDGKIHSIIYKLNHNESEIIYTGNDQVNAGKYSVTAEVKETKNYKGVVVTNELIINKAETVLTLDSLTEYTYDGKVHSIVYKINHNESKIIYTGNDQVNAGNYDVSIEVKESDNYKGLSFTKELIINKAESIIETENITVTYDKETHSIVGTLNHNETQVEYIGNDKVNAGEYVVVLYAKETTNYKEARKEAKLVINKADSVITLDSGLEFVYNGSVQGIKCKLNHTEGTLVYSNNNNIKGGYYNTTVSISGCNNYTDLTVSYDYAIYYSVKLYAYDGTLLYEDLVVSSDEIKYNGIPEMPSTKDYYYEFLGWDVDFTNISSNIVSKALFVKHEFTYTVRFVDANGNVLEEISGLNYGTQVTSSIKPVLSSTDINKAYLFRGFEDVNYDNFTYISDHEKLITIKAITEEVPAVCAIGSLYYGSIFDASIAAETNDVITVIKNNNALYDIYEDVTIPQDVTLYIPYAAGIDVNKPYCDVVEGKMSEDYIYINVNLYGSLTIYGKLVIGGSTGSVGGRIQGAVCGAYSQLTTFDGATINVGEAKGSYSSLIECHGFIRDKSSSTDRATINVYATSTVIQPFVLTDWLGGTYALNAFTAKTSVFNRYQMPCIEPVTTYYLNSLLKGIGKIYAGGQMNQTTFRIFGSEGTNHGLLRLTGTNPNDRIVFDFSSSTTFPDSSVYTDHCDIQIYGDSADRHLQLVISSTNSVSTKNVQFPLHYGLNISFMEGTFTAICKYKVLPGAVVTVGEKATIKLQSAHLNVYSSYEHPDSDCNYPIAEELNAIGKDTFGRLINNGSVVAQTLYPSYLGGNLEGTGLLSLPNKTKLYCNTINRYYVSGVMTSDDYTNNLYYNGKQITANGDYKGN